MGHNEEKRLFLLPTDASPSIERRRSARIPMRHPVVRFWQSGETKRVEATFTTAISRFGCDLHSRMFFPPGTRVKLEFTDKSIEGRVDHSLKDHSTNWVSMGLTFDRDAGEFWQVAFEYQQL